jgi:hypothetical protein
VPISRLVKESITFEQIVKLSDVRLHRGQELAVPFGLAAAHIEFFKLPRQLDTGHLPGLFFDMIGDVILERIGYLSGCESEVGSYGPDGSAYLLDFVA